MEDTRQGQCDQALTLLRGQVTFLPHVLDPNGLEPADSAEIGADDASIYYELLRENVWPFVAGDTTETHHHIAAPAIVIQTDCPVQFPSYLPCSDFTTSPDDFDYSLFPIQSSNGTGDLSPIPSMTSCATTNSLQNLQHVANAPYTGEFFPTMDDPIFAPLEAFNVLAEPTLSLSDTTHLEVSRSCSASKRLSVDLDRSEDLEPPPSFKRNKSVKGGYRCHFASCSKVFDRACDEHKHFKNKHSGDKPHGCPQCEKHFAYPKDVKRHLRQMHTKGNSMRPSTPQPTAGDERPCLQLRPEINQWDGQYNMSSTSFGTRGSSRPRHRRLSTSLKTVVSLLSSLKLWKSDDPISEEEAEEAENFILVTQDHQDYRKVYLSGVETAEHLIEEVAAVFGRRLHHPQGVFLTRCVGKGRLGKRLAGKQLMAAVGKAKMGKALELFFVPHQEDGLEWKGDIQ